MVVGSGRQWCYAVSFPVILVCAVRCFWDVGGLGWVLVDDQVINACHGWRREAMGTSLVDLQWRRAGWG